MADGVSAEVICKLLIYNELTAFWAYRYGLNVVLPQSQKDENQARQ